MPNKTLDEENLIFMTMKYIMKNLLLCSLLGLGLLSLIACKKDTATKLTAEILEVFEVTGEGAKLKPSVLKYKDVKYYKAGALVAQDFYHVDNTLKAFEIIKRDGDTGISNYFSPDSALMAIYHLEYTGEHISKRTGYDGNTKELLRYEVYGRDAAGNLTTKEIYDSAGTNVRSFRMQHDPLGNELQVDHVGAEGKILMQESYEIIKKDDKQEWLEKWGRVNGKVTSFHRRSFKVIS